MKKCLITILFALTAFVFKAEAQEFVLSGRIVNEDNKPVSFVSMYIRNSTYGTTSNEDGFYQFKLSPGTYSIIYRFVGYKQQTKVVTITGGNQKIDVKLEKEIYQPYVIGQSARNGRDTSAINIMRKVIANREVYLNQTNSYSCAVYIKGVQKLVGAPHDLINNGVSKELELDSTGRGILYQSEMLSTFTAQGDGDVKEVTIAQRMAGITPTFSYTKASDLQANFYNNVFMVNGLSSRGFVSPLASYAFKYYNFKLIATSRNNGETIDKIQLLPKHEHDPVFRGYIYIIEGDWRLYAVDLILTNGNNGLNLVDTMRISQQYVPVSDSTWMPSAIEYDYNGAVFGFKFEGYYIGIYNNYKFNVPTPHRFFNGEVLRIDTAANSKTPAYWEGARPVPLTQQEALDYRKKDSIATIRRSDRYLDSLQKEKNDLEPIPYLIFDYAASSRDNKDSLYVAPLLQTLFYNTVEGYGINLKARYVKTLDDFRNISISPGIRYGLANKLFSANLRSYYTYDPFHNGKYFLDFGTDVLDLNNVGTRSTFFNSISTLVSERNIVKYYRSAFAGIGFQRELYNGVLWRADLNYSSRTQLFNNSYNHWFDNKNREYTSNNPLAPVGTPADDRSVLFPKHQALTFTTSVKLTFDQEYVTRPTGRVYLPSKYPTLTVTYRKGINNALGSDVNYDFAGIDVSQERIRVGLFGYSAFKLAAGNFFNNKTLYYPDYYHFLGNQGTTFDPTYVGSFHFLPFYTFSANGSFLEAHYQHNFSGAISNRIPFLRKLKLEEIIGANYLTQKTNPSYTEFYVGIQRLIFRIDYGVSYFGSQKYLQGFRIFYGIR